LHLDKRKERKKKLLMKKRKKIILMRKERREKVKKVKVETRMMKRAMGLLKNLRKRKKRNKRTSKEINKRLELSVISLQTKLCFTIQMEISWSQKKVQTNQKS
jgi:hypothetical protein